MKRCIGCQTEKSRDEFADCASRDGKKARCKPCVKAYLAAYRNANAEAVLTVKLAYRSANREEEADRARARRQRNLEEFCRKDRERYRAASPEKLRELIQRARDWDRRNPEKRYARVARRRAAVAKRTPAWADAAKIAAVYAEANKMRRAGVAVEVDHFYPLHGRTVCGLHVHGNLHIVPETLNRKKSNLLPEEVFDCACIAGLERVRSRI